MSRLILFVLILIAGFSIFFAPWIAGLAYVINSLLQPQYLWPWVFQGIPIFRVTAALAIIGFLFVVAKDSKTTKIYKNKQNFFLAFIWGWMHLSNFLSPFKGAPVSVPPETVLGTLNSIMVMYFVLLPLLNNQKALKYICLTFILVGAYYVYWANSIYLNQEWHRFVNNRLTGPSLSPYRDANALSTLIVMTLPFVIFLYFKVEKKISKIAIIIFIPLAWHSIVLFSSRAALLASVFSLVLVAYVIKSKKINIVLSVSFIIFLTYQGSLLISRTADTVEEARVNAEQPINPRLISWEAGLRLIPEYPFFGAGVQMFEAATRQHFPGMTPHVAHNTFINFSANTGLISGLMFLGLIYISWCRLRFAINLNRSLHELSYYATISSSVSLLVFFVSSLFLDLIIFEPFYIVLIINLISWNLLQNEQKYLGRLDE